MRSLSLITVASAVMMMASIATSAQQVNSMKPKNELDSASYAIGVQIGKSFQDQQLEVNSEMVAAGLRDMMAGKALISMDDVNTLMGALQAKQMAKMQAESARKGETNKVKGEAFLAENKKKKGVLTTPSGLQYMVVTQGTGRKPSKENTVKVHYTGTLLDGTVFDSSVKRGEPIEFPLGNVIAGWTEGVQLMPIGSKYTFYIPSDLAYGANGAGSSIGPNETLIFEVELLDITK